jgi:hypothetical protein
VVEQQDLQALLRRHASAKQAGGTRANDDHIK